MSGSDIKGESVRITDENVNELRKSWETRDQWLLRRDFMIANKYKITDTIELQKMSDLFMNVHYHGVCYSEKIMDDLADLSKGIPFLEKYQGKKMAQLRARFEEKNPEDYCDQDCPGGQSFCFGRGIGRGTYFPRSRGRGRR